MGNKKGYSRDVCGVCGKEIMVVDNVVCRGLCRGCWLMKVLKQGGGVV